MERCLGMRLGFAASCFLLVAASSACAVPNPVGGVCTSASCTNGATFHSSSIATLLSQPDAATIRTCVDANCVTSRIQGGRCSSHECRNDSVYMELPEDYDPGVFDHTVSVTISGANGSPILHREVAHIRFVALHPNGTRCGPTCYQADVYLAS